MILFSKGRPRTRKPPKVCHSSSKSFVCFENIWALMSDVGICLQEAEEEDVDESLKEV